MQILADGLDLLISHMWSMRHKQMWTNDKKRKGSETERMRHKKMPLCALKPIYHIYMFTIIYFISPICAHVIRILLDRAKCVYEPTNGTEEMNMQKM